MKEFWLTEVDEARDQELKAGCQANLQSVRAQKRRLLWMTMHPFDRELRFVAEPVPMPSKAKWIAWEQSLADRHRRELNPYLPLVRAPASALPPPR